MNLLPPKHQLSKTTFMYGVQCAKRVWLNKHLPKERDVQTALQTRIFKQGTDLGLLAQQLFPGGINAEPENYYSFQQSVADTMRYFRRGHQIIYEAAFQFEGILCAVDILVKVNTKWYAYEVKSTTGVKDAQIYDAALQYYVLTNAGIDLEDFSIVHLNRNYIRQGDLNIQQLFQPVSVLEKVQQLNPFISSKSGELLNVLSKNTPPEKEVGEHCMIPYPCDFQRFCNQGIFPAEKSAGENELDKNQLISWAGRLDYPLSYLSMLTWNSAIPLFDGHFPYQSVCFQFTLYKQEAIEGPLIKGHFLENGMNSEQKELIEKLIEAAGERGSIIVHCDSYLKYHLQELKKKFRCLETEINSLQKRIVELPAPFQVDFKMNELVQESVSADDLEKNSAQHFPVMDASSAAAAYFNLKEEKNSQNMHSVRNALIHYNDKITLDIASLVRTISLFKKN